MVAGAWTLSTGRESAALEGAGVFWTVMTILSAGVAITYGLIGRLGPRRGISADRARKFRSSSWLAVGWMAVCLGHYLIARRS